MWPKAEVDYPADEKLLRYLRASEVGATRLPLAEHKRWETEWRKVYQMAFMPDRKFLHGAKADHAFLHEPCECWSVIPFFSTVPGTSVHVHHLAMNAYECHGPLLSLEEFRNVEFFVAPLDLAWTFVRTHEDYVFGGPYFARAERRKEDYNV